MTGTSNPYFTFGVERALTKALGLHQANAAASAYFYPDRLFEMVQENLIGARRDGSPHPDWAGPVVFRALTYETSRLRGDG
jgi:hypothetical protein